MEFFLVATFLIALSAALLSTAGQQLDEVSALQKATLSKAALDAVASWVNQAHLQGNSSLFTGTIFVPAGSVCLILTRNGDETYFTCDAHPSLQKKVYSRLVYTSSLTFSTDCPPTNQKTGWFKVTAKNAAGTIEVTCKKIE